MFKLQKSLFILVLIFFITINVSGQNRKTSSIFFELGGNSLVYSLNYDRLFSDDLSIRAGLMGFVLSSESTGILAIGVPFTGSYFIGKGNHRLEIGVGFLYLSGEVGAHRVSGKVAGISPTGIIGYRFHPIDGKTLFKVGFTPIYISNKFLPWGGLSIGYLF